MAHVNKGYHFDGDLVENGSHPDSKTSTNAALLNKEHRISKLSMIIKFLVFLLLAAVVAVIVIAVLYAEKGEDDDNVKADASKPVIKPPEVCMTADCVMSAAKIYSKMNMEADPCEDFYEFACGRWIEENEVPEDSTSLTTFTDVIKIVNRKIHGILEAEKKEEDPDYLNEARELYASCMDTATVEKRGMEPLKDLLDEVFGSVPVLDPSWNEADFDLNSHLQKSFVLGQHLLFQVSVGFDIKRDSKNVLKVDQPTLRLQSRDNYRNSFLLKLYEATISRWAILMGANETTAKEDAAAVVEFEIELANISVPASERKYAWKSYNQTTLEVIHNEFKGIFDWKKYVKGLTETFGVNPPVTDTERMLTYAPTFLSSLKELLKNTPNRVLANYVVVQVGFNYNSWLPSQMSSLHLKYDKVLYGKSSESPRTQLCMQVVSNVMGLAVGQTYVQENFDPEAKKEVVTMIQNLKNAFDQLLDELEWMDKETKGLAREKNKHIVSSIGYPEIILDNNYLKEKYANYNFSTDDLFNNVRMSEKELLRVQFVNLRNDVDHREWRSPPHTVNAFYNFLENQIMFPAGILNPPFFSFTYPKSMMYGGIGMVIGHEITHGFDDNGSQFNKDGVLAKWWNDDAILRFNAQKQCIIDQYSNFTAEQVNKSVDGTKTQGENIADNGGLRQSFRAYRNWVAAQGQEEPLLPGLDFNHNQLFFLSYGQLWCQKWTDGGLRTKILMGPHSPGVFRVVGPIQNSDGFAEAFNCKPGSPMSREDKCRVW